MDVEKLKKAGEEAQGLLTINVLTTRGAYTEDRVRFSQRCREGKGKWLKVLVKEILIRDMEKKYAHQQKTPYPWRFAGAIQAI